MKSEVTTPAHKSYDFATHPRPHLVVAEDGPDNKVILLVNNYARLIVVGRLQGNTSRIGYSVHVDSGLYDISKFEQFDGTVTLSNRA